MPLDPQIPLAAAQQPSFGQQAGQALQLAGAYEKQQEIQQQRQDQQIIQQALKEGANFNTPEGIAAAAEQLKGKVSVQTYQTLTQAHSEMQMNKAKQEEAYAKMQPELLEGQMKQYDFIAQNLEGALSAYDSARAEKGEQGAMQDFENAKKQIIQTASQQQGPGGRPLINPQLLQQFAGMNPRQVQSALMGTKYQQERVKSGLDLQLKQAQIEKEKALTKKYGREAAGGAGAVPAEITASDATGQELLDMLPPGDAKRVQAIAEGRLQLSDLPARGGVRDKYSQLVNQYDPNFVSYLGKTKAAVEKDFSSGVASRNIASINTAIGHLGTLNQLGVALQNKDSQTLNKITNAISREFGDPNITNYELAQGALGEELMRTFRGVGASVTEAEQWKNQLGAARTPQQMLQVVRTAGDLLESRISAMDSAYKRGTKSEKGYQDILDPKSVNVLSSITGKDYWSIYNLSGKGRSSSVGGKPEKSTEVPRGAEDIMSILKKHGVK